MMLSRLHSLVCLLLLKGVICQKWSVTYSTNSICALEGSAMNLSCSYTYPNALRVREAFWINKNSDTPVDLSKTPKYSHRVQVDCRSDNNTCHLHLRNPTKEDTHRPYYCRITTNEEKQKWIGKPGVKLSVTGLEVTGPQYLTDKDNVTLSCKTTCSLSGNPWFVWKKNGRLVERDHLGASELHLRSVRNGDEGSYTCAVRGHEDLPSPPLRLGFPSPPKNTSALVSPSGEILEGTTVTLTCSSDAYPPVENYTWFKSGSDLSFLGYGQNHSIVNISSEDGGQYYCEARNQHGVENSTAVSITVEEDKALLIHIGIGVTAGCGLLGLVCLACFFRKCQQCGAENRMESSRQNATMVTSNCGNRDQGSDENYEMSDDNNYDHDDIYQNV